MIYWTTLESNHLKEQNIHVDYKYNNVLNTLQCARHRKLLFNFIHTFCSGKMKKAKHNKQIDNCLTLKQ